jgi:hypothetical protein
MSTTQNRRTFLDKLLGKKEPDSVSEVMAKLEATLEAKGVDRKELDVDKTKAFMEKVHAEMAKVIGKITDDAELINQVASEAIGVAMANILGAAQEAGIDDELEEAIEDEGVETEVATETETETMQEDEEEEEEEVPEQLMELVKANQALADESNENMKAMKELIPAVVDALKMVEKLQPVAENVDTLRGLIDRVDKVESLFKQRPRAASSAKETIVENDELKSQIKKGAEGQKTLLGFPVKSQ